MNRFCRITIVSVILTLTSTGSMGFESVGTFHFGMGGCDGAPSNCGGGGGGGGGRGGGDSRTSTSGLAGLWRANLPPGYPPTDLIMRLEDTEGGIRYRFLIADNPDIHQWVDLKSNKGTYSNTDINVTIKKVNDTNIELSTDGGTRLIFVLVDQLLQSPQPATLGTHGLTEERNTHCRHLLSRQPMEPDRWRSNSAQKDLFASSRPQTLFVDYQPRTSLHRGEEEGSKRIQLDPTPYWIRYGGWTSNGMELYVVDALNSRVLLYSNAGVLQKAEAYNSANRFLGVRSTNEGKLVVGLAHEFSTLSSNLISLENPFGLSERINNSNLMLPALADWALIGTRGLGFGHLYRKDMGWKQGFYSFDLDGKIPPQLILELDFDNFSSHFYFLGNPYIATLEDQAFILLMKSKPELLKVLGRGQLEHLTDRFEMNYRLPDVTTTDGFAETADIFGRIERARMPISIHGWRDAIYILSRKPDPATNATIWSLSAIDPESGAILGAMSLPTNARHVVAWPGPREWAFLEHGQVLSFGQHRVESILLVPHWKIEKLTSKSADRSWDDLGRPERKPRSFVLRRSGDGMAFASM